MITKNDAIISLVPNSSFSVDPDGKVHWVVPEIAPVTEDQIQNEITRLTLLEPFNNCKAKAKELIAKSDWAALPDVGLKNAAEFVTYRGILRGLIITPVADPVWPTEPTPIWE